MKNLRLAVLLASLVTISDAQSVGPTLGETGDWIAKTLRIYGGDNDTEAFMAFREDIGNPKLDECMFSYDSVTPRMDTHHKLSGWDTTHIAVPLNEVTSVAGYWSAHNAGGPFDGFHLNTKPLALISIGGQRTGDLQIPVQKFPQAGALPDGTVPKDPTEMASRLINAFQHAVSLCRSMHPPTAAPKDPF
jgi:hypothetical protein